MEFRTRAQWGATFDPSGIRTISLPRALLFIHHNVMKPTKDPNADMRATEQVDIARFGLPSYKFAIHPSGVVLQGMTNHSSPDTYGHNDDISIMFMGNFEEDQPTDAAMFACRELIPKLKVQGLLTQNFQLLGHRDVFQTACPGKNLYSRLSELLVPPPSIVDGVMREARKDNMVLQDPTSGGYWVAYDTGAIAAYDGAPYLGGCNNSKYNAGNKPCVGIARFADGRGEGYALVLDFGEGSGGDRFRRYKFDRAGTAKV